MFQSRWLLPLLTVCLAATAMADVRFVDADAGPGGDGRSWETAYRYLQDAVFEARGDAAIVELRMADGVYHPDQAETVVLPADDPTISFEIRTDLSLLGGFRGANDEGLDPNDRNPTTFPTALSGALTDEIHSARLLDVEQCALELDGVRLVDTWDLEPGTGLGGGMALRMASGMVRNCHFERLGAGERDERVYLSGGAIHATQSQITIEKSVFLRNQAVYGADVFVTDPVGEVVVRSCLFGERYSTGPPVDVRGDAWIVDCIFRDFVHLYSGTIPTRQEGLTRVEGCLIERCSWWPVPLATVEYSDCTFRDQHLFVKSGVRTSFRNCTFKDASVRVRMQPTEFVDCVIQDTAYHESEGGDVAYRRCTFADLDMNMRLQSAHFGECVFENVRAYSHNLVDVDPGVFEACRFERVNTRAIVGRGVAHFERCAFVECILDFVSEDDGLVRNCLFVRNEIAWEIGPDVEFCTLVETTGARRAISVRNSLVAGGDARVTQDTFEIREAGFVDPEHDDYRLRADSPAINAALDPFVADLLDFDSNPRVYGASADLGAFEAVFDDCDADGHPDVDRIRRHASQQGLDATVPATWALTGLSAATDAVRLDVLARGPFRQTTRFVEVSFGGDALAQLFVEDIGQDCGDYGEESIRIPADAFNHALGQDGQLDLVFTVINPGPRCDLDMLLRLEYDAKLDADESGTIDECQRRGDLDGDGVVGLSDLASVLASFGQVGEGLSGDVDLDRDVDSTDLAIVLAAFGS